MPHIAQVIVYLPREIVTQPFQLVFCVVIQEEDRLNSGQREDAGQQNEKQS